MSTSHQVLWYGCRFRLPLHYSLRIRLLHCFRCNICASELPFVYWTVSYDIVLFWGVINDLIWNCLLMLACKHNNFAGHSRFCARPHWSSDSGAQIHREYPDATRSCHGRDLKGRCEDPTAVSDGLRRPGIRAALPPGRWCCSKWPGLHHFRWAPWGCTGSHQHHWLPPTFPLPQKNTMNPPLRQCLLMASLVKSEIQRL